MLKTNAVRMLDKLKTSYELREYDASDGLIDGLSVAAKLGVDASMLCKTLVCRGNKGHYVFVVPVSSSLDLKAAASAAGEKKIEMLPQKELKPLTGYVHGGCSPLGMKKVFPTFIDASVERLEKIGVSAGAIGLQVMLSPKALADILSASFVKLV
ncbi:MAG TPA: Cys-tRNA(Pro) deacylase [Bacillota bacterium]|nr:Cys-tRNA(Pro) deacylase [Bacillota bacterium]